MPFLVYGLKQQWAARNRRCMVYGYDKPGKQRPPVEDQGRVAGHNLTTMNATGSKTCPAPLSIQLVEGIFYIDTIPIVLGKG
ncbi:hypothetical protein ACFL0M_09050 [Thermodesulfobacteriota bacterium]